MACILKFKKKNFIEELLKIIQSEINILHKQIQELTSEVMKCKEQLNTTLMKGKK